VGLVTDVAGVSTNLNLTLYALLAGRAAQQTLSGQNIANGVLGLQGTSHATVTTARVDIIGSDLKMATAGKSILDSGGTARIGLSTASPHATLTGDVKVTGVMAVYGTTINPAVALRIAAEFTVATSWVGIEVSPTMDTTLALGSLTMIKGLPFIFPTTSGLTYNEVVGLSYVAKVGTNLLASSGTHTTTTLCGAQVGVIALAQGTGKVLTITSMHGLLVKQNFPFARTGTATLAVTKYTGIELQSVDGTDVPVGSVTSFYSLLINGLTEGTPLNNRWGISIGDHSVNLPSGSSAYGVDIANFATAGAGGGVSIGIRNASGTTYTPSTAQTLAAGTAILANATVVRINSAGNVTLTSAPTIADGQDGQVVTILNIDTTDTITLQDQGTLANSNLRLSATGIALGPRDSIQLMYSADVGDWVQIGQINVV
jgi:hypothetical protein